MKWEDKEIEQAIDLLLCGNDFETIGIKLNRGKKSIKEKLNKLGYKQSDFVSKNFYCEKKCEYCGNEFNSLISENRKFCSHSCSASLNNSNRVKNTENYNEVKRKQYNKRKKKECLNCGKITTNKYCSQTCQHEHKRNEVFKLIESGDTSLNSTKYKKYLIHVHGEKCMNCGWCEKNPTSNKIPIELEHIYGDSENNKLDNLRLLCPNCHSLTPTYKALNKGNGRHSRMVRYNEGKSY